MNNERKKCLRDLTVFSRLNDKEIELICQGGYEKVYKEGEIIFFENDSFKKLYLLVNGKVKLSMLSPDGKEKVMTILQQGDSLGEISLFDQDPHPLTAEVVEEAQLMIIPWNNLEKIIIKHPRLALKIIEALSKKTRLLTSQVRDLVFQDAAGRLASLLTRFKEDFGIAIDEGKMINLVLTHQEIANLLGTSRVTVTKMMNRFIEENIIKIKDRKIIIINEERLGEKLQTIL
jgi:CRP/FNR family transcriptional regulator